MKLRQFLHFFGIHQWGKWSEIKRIGYTTPGLLYITMEQEYISRPIYGQERYCLICNVKQAKEVKL